MLSTEGNRQSTSVPPTSKQYEIEHRTTTETDYTDRTSKHYSVDFHKSLEFVPPIAGTPAAVALAGKLTEILR